jgi:organic hydroperoxide reductase OsmC/OhrA
VSAEHSYRAGVRWQGSTGVGYDHYDRNHDTGGLPMSADPHFRGDPGRLNPEVLLVMAAASCQLLSFLAVCARARIDVVGYEDDAEGVMPEDEKPVRITRIVLRPRVEIAGEASEARLHKLAQLAHRECYIANSLKTEVVVEPVFSFRAVA